MEHNKLILSGGRLIDPSCQREERCDILIQNGRIDAIGNISESDRYGAEVMELDGKVVAPGFVDVHVHFREPGQTHKEDIVSGAQAAAAGGYTSVVMMANTMPKIDTIETLRYVLDAGARTPIHVHSIAAITRGFNGKDLTDMEALHAAGAVGFSDDGLPLLDRKVVKAAMEEAVKLNVPLSFHEEDPLFNGIHGINDGAVSAQLGFEGARRSAEDIMVARDVVLALDTGATISIQHISSKRSIAWIRLAKSMGAKVHAEVTPHHFTLTEDAVLKYRSLAKMNPPLRTQEDREAILEGLADGTLDLIATDHAPHTMEEKEIELTKAPSGIIGLETALGLGVKHLVQTGVLSMMQLVEKMSTNPAKLYGLEAGSLQVGDRADLVIFAPEEEWTVEVFRSKSSNSPFLGEVLPAPIDITMCGGRIVYQRESKSS